MNKSSDSLPRPKLKANHLELLLWLIPVAAALLCGTFVYRDVIAAGPTITIYFKDADGLVERNTHVRYLGTSVGEVKSISIGKDESRVKVVVQLTGFARNLPRTGTRFWIVRPEVKIGSISGLNTIVSGEYIAIDPGVGAKTNLFTGLEQPPLPRETNTLTVTLLSPALDSIQESSPVLYRGIQVGEVTSVQLSKNSKDVVIQARIHEQYVPLIRPETKFWNAGGVSIHFGLIHGMNIAAESARTLLGGGIEFATPETFGDRVTNETVFSLNAKPDEKWKTWRPGIGLKISDSVPQTTNTPAQLINDVK